MSGWAIPGRMRELIRGGNLYLTAQDAIALAIENNIDLEVDRYNPILSAWAIQRAAGRRRGPRRDEFIHQLGQFRHQRTGCRRQPGQRRCQHNGQ